MTTCRDCGDPGGMWGLCDSCRAVRTERVRASLSTDGGEDPDPDPDPEPEVAEEPEEREWSGYQPRQTADADYYALHFEGRISTASTNQLLNRLQSASRVIRWAQRKPASLRAMNGIGDRTIEKLAALDESAIQTPEERGEPEQRKPRRHRPEGDGLAAFAIGEGDEGGDGGR